MTTSKKGIDLIANFEGCRLRAYLCSAGVSTIGYGTTVYDNGQKVKLGDQITLQRAKELLAHEVAMKAIGVKNLLGDTIVTQNQFDALVSFAYNCGTGALKTSTLLKKVKANPQDPAIRDEFRKWVKAAGKVLPGLVARRNREADLYFTA
jgi:lysozyme